MRTGAVIMSVLLVTSLLPSGAVGAAESGPLADAGLDQEVTQGSTVYLDGGGSYAPDGKITEYEWSIETPSGEIVEPAEPTDEQTSFEATEHGTYEVTLTVTDDDGGTGEDTLFVEVETGEEPVVSLDGPATTTPGTEVTFTATVDAGDAPIDKLVWHVDGEEVHRSDGEPGSTSFEHVFVTLGEQDISVAVVDTAGQRDTAEHSLDVQEPSDDTTAGWYSGLANRYDPSIDGPQLVDGEEPLDARYELVSSHSNAIDRVIWRVDGEPVATGSGSAFTVTWDPGRYELSAVVKYEDGSKRIATFSNGEREVVANPKPHVEVRDPNGFDESISGTAYANDEFAGIQAISVEVDGTEVQRWVAPLEFESEAATDFVYENAVDGDSHEVTVVVTDKLGQTTVVTEEVDVVGKPEIVSAEFLNDPVDSYHERIDPERYTAEFEMVVDLNGVDQEDLYMTFEPRIDGIFKLSDSRENMISNETVVFKVFVAGNEPLFHPYDSAVKIDTGYQLVQTDSRTDTLHVEESPPEVRLNIQVEQDDNRHTRRIRVDASDSFDPDGGELEFSWDPEDEEESVRWSTTTMNLNQPINLLVVDEDGNRKYVNRPAIEFYSPELNEFRLQNEPYEPGETVRVEAIFEVHDTSDEAFQQSELGLDLLETSGKITSWQKTAGSSAGQTSRREGVIEVLVREFFGESHPRVQVYNKKNPDQTARTYELPDPQFENLDEELRKNVAVEETEYLIEKPIYEEITVESRNAVRLFEMEGFEQYSTETTADYRIEKHHYQEAEYETETKSFDSRTQRNTFLKMAVDWRPAGEETRTEIKTTTETEWRRSMYGPGEFTGTTRRIKTQRAQYRTLHEYSSRFGWTYWSTHGRLRGDTRTGRTKREQTQSANYRTVYKFRVTSTERVETTNYVAEKRVQTQRKIDEWRAYTTTNTKQQAEQLAQADDLRIGGVTTDTAWNLRKEVDSEFVVVDEVEDESGVVETRAVVEGDLVEYTIDKNGAEGDVRQLETFTENIRETGFASEPELLDIAYETDLSQEYCENRKSKRCVA